MTNRGPTNPLGVSGSVATAGLPRPEAGAALEGAIKPSAELAAARRDVVPTPLNDQIEKTQVRPASTASHAAVARGAAQGMAHRSQSGSVGHLRTRARRAPQVNTKTNNAEGLDAEGSRRSPVAPTAMASRAQPASRDQGWRPSSPRSFRRNFRASMLLNVSFRRLLLLGSRRYER